MHGSTKQPRHAYHDGCVPVLRFLADRLYLFSFILSDDTLMLRHFVAHYKRLGVLPAHMSVAVRARQSTTVAAANATLDAIRAAGVPSENLQIVHAPPSDSLKIELMNRHIASLPLSAWAIYADVDELFDYPCELQGAVERLRVCYLGTMWDQMAITGNITELMEAPDLAVQYPLQCRIRASIPGQQHTKVILHRALGQNRNPQPGDQRNRFRTTHAVVGNLTHTACRTRGLVRHYTMTTRQMRSTAQKAAFRAGAGLGAMLTVRGDGSAHPSAAQHRNYANASCGPSVNDDTRTGGCKDYQSMLQFMQKQVVAANQGTALDQLRTLRLCPQSLTKMEVGAPCDSVHRNGSCLP